MRTGTTGQPGDRQPSENDGMSVRVFDVIIFNFDGVLANTRDEQITIWETVCRDIGLQVPSGLLRELIGYSDKQIAQKVCEQLQIQAADLPEIIVRKKRHLSQNLTVDQKEDAGEVLRALDALGAMMVVVTDRHGDSVNPLIQNWGWDQWLTYMLASNLVGPEARVSSKPSPETYLTALQRLGVLPSRCLVVEDTLPGLIAANEAGCVSVGLTGIVSIPELEIHADCVITDLSEVVELMQIVEPNTCTIHERKVQ